MNKENKAETAEYDYIGYLPCGCEVIRIAHHNKQITAERISRAIINGLRLKVEPVNLRPFITCKDYPHDQLVAYPHFYYIARAWCGCVYQIASHRPDELEDTAAIVARMITNPFDLRVETADTFDFDHVLIGVCNHPRQVEGAGVQMRLVF